DILQIVAATYLSPGEESVISRNSFSLYELVTRVFGGKPVFAELRDNAVDLDAVSSAVTDRTKLIFLTNPNNPTGTIFSSGQLEIFMKRVPDRALVVMDEAYMEFAENGDFPDCLKYVRDGANLMVVRTFSKVYGLAGLRAGYGIARKEIVSPMFLSKMPFNVSRLAQAGAAAALGDREFVERTLRNNSEGKRTLYAEFDQLGLSYKRTESNFIFVDLGRPADEVFLRMMAEGVIIRPLSSFGFPQAIRVSIGSPDQNRKLCEALKKVLA
ncbi:MAG TPA: histidinol-phosphate transaminase, partial [Candidatus Omnitrophota bacterium]|nr:histidinol-phosphate transaminase [Candidatus Omnitrophota bacterium]